MKILARAGHEFKSLFSEVKSLPFSRSGMGGYGTSGGSWYGTSGSLIGAKLPGSNYDYQSVAGVLWQNPSAAACFVALTKAFAQARPQLEQRVKGKGDEPDTWEVIDDHPLAEHLNQPNKFYSGERLFGVSLVSMMSNGSAFWRMERNSINQPVELWFEPPVGVGSTGIAPNWDAKEFIKDYAYFVDGKRHDKPLKREDVVYFRHGLNPSNPRLPWSPLSLAAREIATLNSASTWTGAIMRNGGAPGGMLTLPETVTPGFEYPTVDQVEEAKRTYRQQFTGEGAGGIFASTFPWKFQGVSWSPEQMALKTIQQWPQGIVCALLGTPEIVALLPTGEQPTYQNLDASMKWWWQNTIIPLEDSMADEIETQLFGAYGLDSADWRVTWDRTHVPALQEDLESKHRMLDSSYKAGWMKRSEVRSELGLNSTPEDDVYATSASTTEDDSQQDNQNPAPSANKTLDSDIARTVIVIKNDSVQGYADVSSSDRALSC